MDNQAKTLNDIKEILILGAGTMGLRIGLQAAMSGYQVVIYDLSDVVFEEAQKTQRSILGAMQKQGKVKPEQLDEIFDRIRWTTDLESACKNPDLVNESVPEDLAIKKELWAKVGAMCPARTIFTTNTSYMLPSMMAEDSGRPELFCAFHFHDVFLANVVDIMPHPGTVAWIPELLEDLGRSLKQTPVHIKTEFPGYLFNTMLVSFLGAAGHLVASGVASPEDVDRSWMGNFKMEMGPFGIMDSIGLETAWHVVNNLKDSRSKRFAAFLREYVDAGKLGVKTGEGFYQYPNPKFKQEGFV
jgi:3-hydroxybutyryl-CoA dehydrogenase